jgi:hypothetical protein
LRKLARSLEQLRFESFETPIIQRLLNDCVGQLAAQAINAIPHPAKTTMRLFDERGKLCSLLRSGPKTSKRATE